MIALAEVVAAENVVIPGGGGIYCWVVETKILEERIAKAEYLEIRVEELAILEEGHIFAPPVLGSLKVV